MRRVLIAVSVLALSAPVFAENMDQVPPPPPRSIESGRTVDIIAGLGFGGFTSDLGNASSVGLSWSVRTGYNFNRFLGVELNYQGTDGGANTSGPAGVATLGTAFDEQQITADVKAGPPIWVGFGFLRPYGFAGAGYGYIGENFATPFPTPSISAAAFPLGGGLSYEIAPGFIFDTRYTYNVLTDKAGNNWNVGFNVGARLGAY